MAESGRGRGKKRGCLGCIGCLGALAALVVVLVAVVLFAPGLLRKMGIFGLAAEERYSGAADPVGTQMVTEVLDDAGFKGVDVVVMPVKGSQGQIAVITLDEMSQIGGIDSSVSGEEQFVALIQDFSQANQERELQIDTVAMNFEGENGESLISMSVPQSAIDAYAAGEISRREFVRQVEIDFSNLISVEELQQLITEMEEAQ